MIDVTTRAHRKLREILEEKGEGTLRVFVQGFG
jgi:hypothetical protein